MQFKKFNDKLQGSNTAVDKVNSFSSLYDTLSNLNENNFVKNVAAGMNKKVRTFAILTANNPMEQFLSQEDQEVLNRNRDRYNWFKNVELKAQLKGAAINFSNKEYPVSYSIVSGYYNELPEKSLFIYNITLNQAKYIAGCYKQESFIFGDNRDGQHLVQVYVAKINKTNTKILDYVSMESLSSPDISVKYDETGKPIGFTQKRTFKFSFPFTPDSFNQFTEDLTDVWAIKNEKCFEDSLKEYYTGSRLFQKRCSAYIHDNANSYTNKATLSEAAKTSIDDNPDYYKALLKAYNGLIKRNNGWACVYGFTKNNKFVALDPIYKDDVKSLQNIVKGLRTREHGKTDVEVYTIYKDKLETVKNILIKKGLLKKDFTEGYSTESVTDFGINGVDLVYRGVLSAPELRYKNKFADYQTIEPLLWSRYKREAGDDVSDDQFDSWVSKHAEEVKFLINKFGHRLNEQRKKTDKLIEKYNHGDSLGGIYSIKRHLYNNTFNISGHLSEGIDSEVRDDRLGGVIYFSTDVNSIPRAKNKIVNWLKQKFTTAKQRLFHSKIVKDVLKQKDFEGGFTEGPKCRGRYFDHKNNEIFDERSFSLSFTRIKNEDLIKVAEQICKAFNQQSVLVILRKPAKVIFVNSD